MQIQSTLGDSENIYNKEMERVAASLQKDFNSIGQYHEWLKNALEKIVLDQKLPPVAFRYLIGRDETTWEKDLIAVCNLLDEEHKEYFRRALILCIKDAPTVKNQDVSSNRNSPEEILTITYIDLARGFRIEEVIDTIPEILEKFSESGSIYDSLLLTWRIMAKPNQGDRYSWVAQEFLKDLRYIDKRSTLIAFGLCVTKPEDTLYYLNEWQPLQDYLRDPNIDPKHKAAFMENKEKMIVSFTNNRIESTRLSAEHIIPT